MNKSSGSPGGHARAAKLTPDQRSQSARAAAAARWGKPILSSEPDPAIQHDDPTDPHTKITITSPTTPPITVPKSQVNTGKSAFLHALHQYYDLHTSPYYSASPIRIADLFNEVLELANIHLTINIPANPPQVPPEPSKS